MSLPSDYAAILNELNRDVTRHRPSDPLQFCADWFASKLREERYLSANGGLGTSAAAAAAAAARSTGAPTTSVSAALDHAQLEDTTMSPVSHVGSSGTGSFGTPNPFAAEHSTPSVSATAGAAAAATSPDAAAAAFAPPPNFNFSRRTSVSAESLAPVTSSPASTPSASEPLSKTVIPKSDSQMQRIRASIQNNLLFRNLDEEQERDVLLAMKEMTFEPNTIVIRQGDQGDFFYVVESGSLDVYIKSGGLESSSNTGSLAGRGSVGSIYSTDSDGPATTHLGNTVISGSSESAALGERKLSYGPSDAFGELALLYLQPRAASIVTTSKCVLWALDRVTFRSILMETNSRKRGQLEKFLRDVPLFETLDSAKLAKLADALQFRDYKHGDRIIEQGERGTEFFIIVDGMVSVRKRRDPNATDEDECGTLITGEYFGELALLNNAPRAASIVAIAPSLTHDDAGAPLAAGASAGKVKVAVLSEQAFKRLVGSLASTMELHASTHYVDTNRQDSVSSTGSGAANGSNAARTTAAMAMSGNAAAAAAPQTRGITTAGATSGNMARTPTDDIGPSPHDVDPRSAASMGRWVGGMGSSPFGRTAPSSSAVDGPPPRGP